MSYRIALLREAELAAYGQPKAVSLPALPFVLEV